MTMKKLIFVVLIVAMLAGCSRLIAKPQMAAKIDANAAAAKISAATSQPIDVAKTSLLANSVALDGYYQTATVNLFAYLFSDKQIFCTATYYKILQSNAISSASWSASASAGKFSDNDVQSILAEEYKWFVGWKNAKDSVGE
jgi:hypothetical protein